MPLKLVRQDIVKMQVDAIVNTANEFPIVGPGCDAAIYNAAGYELLLKEREQIGQVPEGQSFCTSAYNLQTRYIIHTVSPLYIDGESGEEQRLRSCYKSSLALAKELGIRSIAFPLISTGSFGYPKEEGLRIAVDEIHAFLEENALMIYLVVFDEQSTQLGKKIAPDLKSYIDAHYVDMVESRPYRMSYDEENRMPSMLPNMAPSLCVASPIYEKDSRKTEKKKEKNSSRKRTSIFGKPKNKSEQIDVEAMNVEASFDFAEDYDASLERLESGINEKIQHMSDTFATYLLYLIETKKMTNAEVYKRGVVDKKVFSKIKNNPEYHPNKMTALCLCIGAKLNLDETKDLLARAGYALSPCDLTDVIFTYFIENEIYDMIELDLQLENHDLPCIIK